MKFCIEGRILKTVGSCLTTVDAALQGGSVECTRWFKYDRDYLCVNKSQFVPVIFEPPCI